VSQVHRVNHAMRGVVLPTAGRHRIKMKYQEPWPKWLILPAAGVAFAALAILCTAFLRRRREVARGWA
jgi:ABC-type branched-subunit amino acid transport system permease subunit